MQALVLEKTNHLRLRDIDLPEERAPGPHEVRIRMSAPVWVLPWSTITSGARLVSGSCAIKLRATPPMLMVSDNAGRATPAIAKTLAIINTRIN